MNISPVVLTNELKALEFTNKDDRKHGWYSKKQHECLKRKLDRKGLPIWVNSIGEKKICTCVSSTIDHGCSFDDMIYLGVMEKWCGTQEFY